MANRRQNATLSTHILCLGSFQLLLGLLESLLLLLADVLTLLGLLSLAERMSATVRQNMGTRSLCCQQVKLICWTGLDRGPNGHLAQVTSATAMTV